MSQTGIRYSQRALPSYPYRPGESPHPLRDPAGHSYGRAEPAPEPPWNPQDWRENPSWLYAVDLFNRGFWWEAHESLEGLWNAAGRKSEDALFVQGLLQVGAGFLNRELGKDGAGDQIEKGLAKMAVKLIEGDVCMGIDILAFSGAVRRSLLSGDKAPTLSLQD